MDRRTVTNCKCAGVASHRCDRMWSRAGLRCVHRASRSPGLSVRLAPPKHNTANRLWWEPPSCPSNWCKYCTFEPAVPSAVPAGPLPPFLLTAGVRGYSLTEWSLEWQPLLEEQLVWHPHRVLERDPSRPPHLDHITWHDLRTDTTSALQHCRPPGHGGIFRGVPLACQNAFLAVRPPFGSNAQCHFKEGYCQRALGPHCLLGLALPAVFHRFRASSHPLETVDVVAND